MSSVCQNPRVSSKTWRWYAAGHFQTSIIIVQLVFWLGKKQIRYQDLNRRKMSAAASPVVSLRGSDYFIFPPAVSPETIADQSAGKIGKQEGKANNKLIRISLPCHPSIPLRFEPSPPVGKTKLFPVSPVVSVRTVSIYRLPHVSL